MFKLTLLQIFLLLHVVTTTSAQTVLDGFDPEAPLEMCRTSIKGEKQLVIFDSEEGALYDNYSFREIFLGGSEYINCPAFVSLRLMTPDLSDIERAPFCLSYDEDGDTFEGYSVGERDAYLFCKQPTRSYCERVNDSKDAALALAGLGAGATTGASLASGAAGVSAVTHSSGAVILSGSSGYIAGTLGTIGASLLSLLTAPVTVAAASVTLVGVGGSVYFCAPDSE